MAKTEIPQEWIVWALAAPDALGGGGIYFKAPRPPQALCFVEALPDGKTNVVYSVLLNPPEMSESVRTACRAWVDSLAPKTVVFRDPEVLKVFKLDLLLMGKTVQLLDEGQEAAASGARDAAAA